MVNMCQRINCFEDAVEGHLFCDVHLAQVTPMEEAALRKRITYIGKILGNDDPRTPAEVAAYEAKQDGEPTSNAYPVHDYMDAEDIETALNSTSKQVIELQTENASLRQQLDAAREENVTLTARNQQLQGDLNAAQDALFPLAEVYEEYLVMFEQGHTIDFETWLSECHGLTARFVKAFDVYTSKQS